MTTMTRSWNRIIASTTRPTGVSVSARSPSTFSTIAVDESETRKPVNTAGPTPTPRSASPPATAPIVSATWSPPPRKIGRASRAISASENSTPIENRSRMTPTSASCATRSDVADEPERLRPDHDAGQQEPGDRAPTGPGSTGTRRRRRRRTGRPVRRRTGGGRRRGAGCVQARAGRGGRPYARAHRPARTACSPKRNRPARAGRRLRGGVDRQLRLRRHPDAARRELVDGVEQAPEGPGPLGSKVEVEQTGVLGLVLRFSVRLARRHEVYERRLAVPRPFRVAVKHGVVGEIDGVGRDCAEAREEPRLVFVTRQHDSDGERKRELPEIAS